MSGPSLRRQDAHSTIHDAALNEAKELRDVFQKCLLEGEKAKALQVAEITIEHWESRTLKHADAEEEGLYKEMAEESPELLNVVTRLTRDHDLMRRIVHQLKDSLATGEVNQQMLSYMDSLLIIDSIHNDDEMNNLLGHEAS
ncbi:hemerythrin domain-containing protein [Neobacillus dielmonensis]|uniref:hemerythrin domain-containing protein n=1 Tax=Neobacillus dielmonensis TaxID=1347369 RepID=UPI0005A93599|nr:hemerythrin domain-containing protein [Neobacillus dielmonensis]